MKRLFILASILLFSFALSAQYYKQKTYYIGGSIGYQYPLGDFADQAKAGSSFRLQGKKMLNKKISVGFELSYSLLGQDDFWNGNHLGEFDVDYNIGTALLNASYYFENWDSDFMPYLSLAFGYYNYRHKVDFNSFSVANENVNLSYTDNNYGITPIVGFMYHIADEWSIDVNLRYLYISNLSDEIKAYSGYDKIAALELSAGLFYRF